MSASEKWVIAALLGVFVFFGFMIFRNGPGDDLASSYIACRLIAEGHEASVYRYHPVWFSMVDDFRWIMTAQATGFTSNLHPYVQIPLWSMMLDPLCTRMNFASFHHLFVFLELLAVVGTVWITVRFLVPGSVSVIRTALALVFLAASFPFLYAMVLAQTHPFVVVAVAGALILSERRAPMAAGILVAGAAALKITPGLVLVYWCARGRWVAAAAAAITMCILAVSTWLFAGPFLTREFVATLERLSTLLLLSENNHSLPAVLVAPFHPDASFQTRGLETFRIHDLPAEIGHVCMALAVACALAAGWLRRQGGSEGLSVSVMLITMTVFAPIAWSHYYIVLIVPLLCFLHQDNRHLRLAAIAFALVASVPHHHVHGALIGGLGMMGLSFGLLVKGQDWKLPSRIIPWPQWSADPEPATIRPL